jgi:hypothetical protein
VYLLQKKIADRKFLKPRKQYPLAIEPKEMIEARPQPRRHVPTESQSEETELMLITTDEDTKQ